MGVSSVLKTSGKYLIFCGTIIAIPPCRINVKIICNFGIRPLKDKRPPPTLKLGWTKKVARKKEKVMSRVALLYEVDRGQGVSS